MSAGVAPTQRRVPTHWYVPTSFDHDPAKRQPPEAHSPHETPCAQLSKSETLGYGLNDPIRRRSMSVPPWSDITQHSPDQIVVPARTAPAHSNAKERATLEIILNKSVSSVELSSKVLSQRKSTDRPSSCVSSSLNTSQHARIVSRALVSPPPPSAHRRPPRTREDSPPRAARKKLGPAP